MCPGNSELSEAEEDTIKDVYTQYGELDQFYLADLTHQYFSEWEYPSGRATSIPVESSRGCIPRRSAAKLGDCNPNLAFGSKTFSIPRPLAAGSVDFS